MAAEQNFLLQYARVSSKPHKGIKGDDPPALPERRADDKTG